MNGRVFVFSTPDGLSEIERIAPGRSWRKLDLDHSAKLHLRKGAIGQWASLTTPVIRYLHAKLSDATGDI